MDPRTKKRLFTLLRVVVCVAALAYVLNGVSWNDSVTLKDGRRIRLIGINEQQGTVTVEHADGGRETVPLDEVATDREGDLQITYGLKTAWRRCRKPMLLLALAAFAPVTFLQSFRFQLMFRAQDIPLSYAESAKLCFAGNFLNWATPIGSTGGDVFKAYQVARHTEQKTEALATILLDRVIGLGALLLLVGVTIELGAADPELAFLGHVINGGILLAIVATVVLFSDRIRERWIPRGLISRIPLEAHVRRVDAATRRLLRHRPLFIAVVLASLLLQLICQSSFVLAAYALQMDFSGSKVFDYYACLGTGNVVAAIPISLQGLGTTEAVYRKFMLGTHGTLSQLLCMAMAVRLIHLTWSLPGAWVALSGGYKLQAAGALDGPP